VGWEQLLTAIARNINEVENQVSRTVSLCVSIMWTCDQTHLSTCQTVLVVSRSLGSHRVCGIAELVISFVLANL